MVAQIRSTKAMLLAGALCAASGALGGERFFGADPVQSDWSFERGPGQCRLLHTVPALGRARFSQHADSPLMFELEILRGDLEAGEATLRVVPPEWRPGHAIEEIGGASLERGAGRLRIFAADAERMLAELEEGLHPAVFFGGGPGAAALISAVRFTPAFDRFLECRGDLRGIDTTALRNGTVRYRSGEVAPTGQAERSLRAIARFVAAGPPERRVLVAAYTDDRGTEAVNRRISLRRAQAVRDFLLAEGVPARQISITGLGEARPLASNRTAAGRDLNRRVELQVIN